MCRIKEYSDRMQSYLNSIVFRIDTYLLPEDLSAQVSFLRDVANAVPSEIPFDEINEQVVDIENVAFAHDSYVNNILDSRTLYFLKYASIDGIEMGIYLNKFFIAFDIPSDGKEIEVIVQSLKDNYLSKTNFPVIGGYLRMNYSLENIGNDVLWDICDKSAFPILEDTGYNGNYSDLIERDGISIDLSRTISQSQIDVDTSDIVIQTKAIILVPDLESIDRTIMDVVSQSKKEVSRCFRS